MRINLTITRSFCFQFHTPIAVLLRFQFDQEGVSDFNFNSIKKLHQLSRKFEPQTGSKLLLARNLSIDIRKNDVRDFFKESGKIAAIKFYRGKQDYCHIKFATEEAAQKAIKLNGKKLLSLPVNLDLLFVRDLDAPRTGGQDSWFFTLHRENDSFKRIRGQAQNTTILISGLDISADEDELRIALIEHFSSCGEITRCSIHPVRNNCPRGVAHVDFATTDGFNKAFDLDGSELFGTYLRVKEDNPTNHSS